MATTPQRRKALRLVCTHGERHTWQEPAIREMPTGGYTLALLCDFGDIRMTHYVARDATTGNVCWRNTPYVFLSLADAEAARDEMAAQQGEGE